jgi:hypothetical protein
MRVEDQVSVIAINQILAAPSTEAICIPSPLALVATMAMQGEVVMEIFEDENTRFFAQAGINGIEIWSYCERAGGKSETVCSASRAEWVACRNELMRD